MKNLVVLFLISTVYLIIVSTLLPTVPLPDVPLLIAFYAGFTLGSIEGAFLCFAIGYLEDVLMGGVLGSGSFTLIVVFLAAHLLSKKVHFTTPAVKAVGGAIMAALKGVLLYLLMSAINNEVRLSGFIFVQALITGAFAPAVINLLERISAAVSPRAFER